jgi:dTDP-glucose pyrophosphorylase
MTYFYYKTNSFNANETPSPETIEFWKSLTKKKNWRIVQLSNGYFQTEFLRSDDQWVDVTRRQSMLEAEKAIDASVEHYEKKLTFAEGPKVVKTFK